MKNIFGCDGLLTDAGFREGEILCNVGMQVMTYHQHVQVFVQCIDRIGTCRIRGRRQHIFLADDRYDVGRVAAPGAFGMERMNSPVFHRGDRVFQKAAFVNGVGMNGYLHIVFVRNIKTVVDGRIGRTPVFVQLETTGTCQYLFFKWSR